MSRVELLTKVRSFMKNPSFAGVSESIAAYIVPTDDAHGSEYIANCDKRREYISGFDGSAGTAVITTDKAALWTDGRYYLQAEQQLDSSCWMLMKDRLPETPTIQDWINKTIPPNSKVGADPFLISQTQWQTLSDGLKECGNTLIGLSPNLIDQVWGKDQPPRPKDSIFSQPLKFSGQSWQDKVVVLREKMTAKKATVCLITALDEIAWLFNLRGSDIEFNPVFFSYAIVTMDRILLFLDDSRLETSAKADLRVTESDGMRVELQKYDSIDTVFRDVVSKTTEGKIWVSSQLFPYFLIISCQLNR